MRKQEGSIADGFKNL